jgi:hypothetical protein
MIKKRHHVVWQGYLRAWAKENLIWFLQGGAIDRTSLGNVAVRKKFYSLRDLTPADYRLAVTLLEQVAPDLRFLAKGWLHLYQQLPRLLRLAQDESLQDSGLGQEIAVLVANFEEDLHAEIETTSIPVLAALRDSDEAIVHEPESFMRFCLFVSAQMLRTPTDLALVQAQIDECALDGDIQAVWGLLRTVFVGVMAFSLGKSMQRTALTYLRAPSDAEFVVGDQPVINLAASSDPTIPPEQLVMYFPVSPTLAAVVDFNSSGRSVDNGTLDAARVGRLNQRMAESADVQVFAASRVALEALCPSEPEAS